MIADMTRVELVCLSSARAKVVESLQSKGLLHLDETPLDVEEAAGFLDRLELEGAELESYTTLDEGERTLNEIAPLLTLQPGEHDVKAAAKSATDAADADLIKKIRGWAEALRTVSRERATRRDAVEVLNNYKRILEQVAPALGGSSVKLGRGTRAVVLQGNVKKIADRLDERLASEIGPQCSFHRNQISRKQLVGLVTFPEAKENEVTRILGQEGVTPVDMRDQSLENATLGEVVGRIDKTITQHQKEMTRLEGEANKLSRQVGAELLGVKLVVADRLSRLRVYGQFAQSKMVTVFQGWTPSDQYPALKQAVEREFPGKVEVNQVGFHDLPHTAVPTLLRNAAFFKPFELPMGLFRPPTYGTSDPTWMVGLSFTIFYGFIMGDAIYGMAIILLALWIKGKFGASEIGRSVGTIAMYMGVSSTVFGVIYGEYAGAFVEKTVWPMISSGAMPVLFHRAHETTQLLVLAIMFGVFLVPTALIMGVRADWHHGHKKHAIEKAGMCMGLLALMSFVFGYFGVPVFNSSFMQIVDVALGAVGVVMIFYAAGAMRGAVGVIEIMSLGGNVLSYARLMALGVASIALADIANMLPGMMGYAIGIPAALLVHLLNLGIGIASPTIHSLRLNFVEFLPKFYSPEGRGFNPFRKETQW